MILAANFKSNHTRAKTAAYLEALEAFVIAQEIHDEIIIFPPATALMQKSLHVKVGAQNAFAVQNGAFTGEIALEQLEEFGIKTILLGHSERRHVLGESQELIAEKFSFYKEKGFRIVYCIGEPLEVREEGNEALLEYLEGQYEGIDFGYDNLIIAYEPVWAIGSGLTPTDEDIVLIHGAIKKVHNKPLLYGGSVKKENARAILGLDHVDGILVGSGALDVNDFLAMIKDAQEINKGVE